MSSILWPYLTPQILTDSLFLAYGGLTGTSPTAMRQAAYGIAEHKASNDLGSYLVPTNVTGVYPFNNNYKISTEHSYINRILDASIIYSNMIYCSCDTNLVSTCALINDDTYGYVDFLPIYTALCGMCGAGSGYPYKFQLTYNAGLPTGTTMNSPEILLALTVISQIYLNEMMHQGNESVGDIGVKEFNTLDYHEVRYGLKKTTFGSSAQANFASNLLKGYRKTKGLAFR